MDSMLKNAPDVRGERQVALATADPFAVKSGQRDIEHQQEHKHPHR
jgi:hypothetical protein